jgi:hypothetical protein
MDDNETPIIEEEEVEDDVKPRASFDKEKIIKSIESSRAEIRTVIPALLETCSLLLTISLGAIYFVIKDNKEPSIYLPDYIRYLLFAIPVLLTLAIAFGILSIYLRKGPSAIDDDTIFLSTLDKNNQVERKWFFCSNVCLGFAILFIIISLLVFTYECNNGNPSQEIAKSELVQNIFLIVSNHTTSADVINVTELAHNFSLLHQ